MEQEYKNKEDHLKHIRAAKIFHIVFIIFFGILLLLLKFYQYIPFYIIISFALLGTITTLFFSFKALLHSWKALNKKIYKKE